jgi:hypothetical protein
MMSESTIFILQRSVVVLFAAIGKEKEKRREKKGKEGLEARRTLQSMIKETREHS